MSQPWRTVVRGGRVLFGAGTLGSLGDEARELGARRTMLVSDPGIDAAGHLARAQASLRAAGLDAVVFDGVEENPSERNVEEGAGLARRHDVDLLVGLGGGSAMDCAKGINFVLTNGGRMEDYWGFNKARLPMLPAIGVPCTAGTGSEAQSYALISRDADHSKMACGDEKARFRTVILDPELACTAPSEVAAAAGIDAVSHAVESFVSTARNPFSQMYAGEAWRRLEANLAPAVGGGGRIEVWGEMVLGAHLAGAAIETSMLGAAHAGANPLTAHHGTVHGVAVGLLLPHVVRFNAEVASELYGRLTGQEAAQAGEALACRLEALLAAAGLPQRLRDIGVDGDDLPRLAEEAAAQWTAGFNPRPAGVAEMRALYEAAF